MHKVNDEEKNETICISQIVFKCPAQEPLQIHLEPGSTLIFVGPNNSGKSLALRELEIHCSTGEKIMDSSIRGQVIDRVDFGTPQDAVGVTRLAKRSAELDTLAEISPEEEITIGGTAYTFRIFSDLVGQKNWGALQRIFVPPFTCLLDGVSRFSLTEAQSRSEASSLKNTPRLLVDNEGALRNVQEKIQNETGFYFFVCQCDAQLAPKIANLKPLASITPCVGKNGKEFCKNAFHFKKRVGDGTRCFMGIVSALWGTAYQIIFIDEPEAFLHPPLQKKLGCYMSALASTRRGTLVAATHSPDYLMGCIETQPKSTIVRLTYDKDSEQGTATVLPPETISEFMKKPLLRSSKVLSALFHERAVVVEGDGDRALYEEINRQLFDRQRGAGDIAFLNANGWPSISKIITLLRKIDVVVSAIMDLDVIRERGDNWSAIFEAFGVPVESRSKLLKKRDALKSSIETVIKKEEEYKRISEPSSEKQLEKQSDYIKKRFKECGILLLQDSGEKSNAKVFLSEMEKYGLYFVPNGCLSSWLPQFGIQSKNEQEWVGAVLKKLEDPASTLQMEGDIWSFVERVVVYRPTVSTKA